MLAVTFKADPSRIRKGHRPGGNYLIEPQSRKIGVLSNGLIGVFPEERSSKEVLITPFSMKVLPYYVLTHVGIGSEWLIPVSGNVPDDFSL